MTDHVTGHVVWRHNSFKHFYWLHDGHVVCRHNFILDHICTAANIIHPHFPALRKVAHNQNLSLLVTSLCQKKFDQKYSKSRIQQDLAKFLQNPSTQQYPSRNQQSSSKQYPSRNQQSSSKQYPSRNQQSSSKQYPSRNQQSSSKQHPRRNQQSSSKQYPSGNQQSSSKQYPSSNQQQLGHN